MTPRLTTRGPFRVLGVLTPVVRGSESPELFGRIWQTFESLRLRIEPHSIRTLYYGVSFPTQREDVTDYLTGMPVPDDTPVSDEVHARTVPGGEFAVFECEVAAIGPTYQYILTVWLPGAPFERDGSRASFEEYPEDTTKLPVRIHIPVRPRPSSTDDR